MHSEIKQFFMRMKLVHGRAFNAQRILECGSYDINGNPRNFFAPDAEYVGIDWRKGPLVDKVSLAHEYKGRPDGYFQLVIATSLLEHDPHWDLSIQRMCALLGYGGSLLITCGGPGFHAHEVETAPAHWRGMTQLPAGQYYSNRTARDIVSELLLVDRFRNVIVEDDPAVKDIRVFAFDKMDPNAGVPAGWNPAKGEPETVEAGRVMPC